jgi:hypothetical protein
VLLITEKYKKLKKFGRHFDNSALSAMLNFCRICRRISMNISKVGNQTSSQDPQAVNSRSVTQSNLIINAVKFI